MNFTKDASSEVTIKRYENNRLKIGNQSIDYSCIVGMNEIIGKWNNKNADNTSIKDLDFLAKRNPDILIFGTGQNAVIPNRNLIFELAKINLGIEVMTTAAACRTFNILISEFIIGVVTSRNYEWHKR